MRKRLLLLLFATLPLNAAILRGYAVEHATGKVLARALIAIQPLPGATGPTMSVRTNGYGVFEFINIPAGAYLVNGSRRGFAPVHYGQKRWNAPGTPVILDADQTTTISLRLPRYGGITGFVVDENDVGIPEHEVAAYRNARPPRMVAKFATDDRGWFRIWGLEPGTYLVRTAGRKFEDADYLPTFSRETLRVEEAGFVQVSLDQDTPDVRVHPLPGKLMNITGGIGACYPPRQVTVTLASDMGRETIVGDASFAFFNKPPGNYEIFAEVPPEPRRANSACGAYLPVSLEDRDSNRGLSLIPLPVLSFSFEGVNGLDPNSVRVLGRRKDLAGESEPQILRLVNGSVQVSPGRWEVQLEPSASFVATGVRGPRLERPASGRADGWVEILVTGPSAVKYTLSDKPGALHGVVTGAAHDPVPGAPVTLESWDPAANQRILALRTVRADMRGRFQVYGLAPGTYRVFSTLDLEAPEPGEVDGLNPKTIRIEEGRDQQLDLDLSVLR